MPADDPRREQLQQRIANYLAHGGLFNPEHMQHDNVRALLLDLNDFLLGVAAEARRNDDKPEPIKSLSPDRSEPLPLGVAAEAARLKELPQCSCEIDRHDFDCPLHGDNPRQTGAQKPKPEEAHGRSPRDLVEAHICAGGSKSIRPYPAFLCSLCMGRGTALTVRELVQMVNDLRKASSVRPHAPSETVPLGDSRQNFSTEADCGLLITEKILRPNGAEEQKPEAPRSASAQLQEELKQAIARGDKWAEIAAELDWELQCLKGQHGLEA